MALAPRNRRTKNYWEAIFDVNLTHSFGYGDWSFQNNLGPHYQCFSADELVKSLKLNQGKKKITGINFVECDFFGRFDELASSIVFEKCSFQKCDFGLSTWDRAKFSQCKFIETSFTQSVLIGCEFRDCMWQKISISGNETRLRETYISNPKKFIRASFVNINKEILLPHGKTPYTQKLKNEETKATVARSIYNNLKNIGDENAFYEACEVSALQGLRFKTHRAVTDILHPTGIKVFVRGLATIALCYLEFLLTLFFGFCNKWGASVGRPLGFLLLSIAIFSIIYHYGFNLDFNDAFSKSLDIGLVAGYTRVATSQKVDTLRYCEWVDLITSLVFYSTFLATIVAKISRVR